jgi:uncharacterized membrane protein
VVQTAEKGIMRHIIRIIVVFLGVCALLALESTRMSGVVRAMVEFLISTVALTVMIMVDTRLKR